jgi:hypothetical protein
MAIRLVLCGLCTPNRPQVYDLALQLQREYRGELVVIEVDCMAACDESPAFMLEHDYYPAVSAPELRRLVEGRLPKPEVRSGSRASLKPEALGADREAGEQQRDS